MSYDLTTHTPEQFIASFEAERLRDLDAAVQKVTNTIEAVKRLNAVGFDLKVNNYNVNFFTMTVEPKDLPKVRRALGRLRPAGKEPVDAKKKTVQVCLTPDDFHRYPIFIYYNQKLPKGAKCRIVSKKVVQHQLVCEV